MDRLDETTGYNNQMAVLFETVDDINSNCKIQTNDINNKIGLVEKDIALLKEEYRDIKESYKEVKTVQAEIKEKLVIFEKKQTSGFKTMSDFINQHKEDAPKAIKTMKFLARSMILGVSFISTMVTGFILFQYYTIVGLQKDNTTLIMKVIEDGEKK